MDETTLAKVEDIFNKQKEFIFHKIKLCVENNNINEYDKRKFLYEAAKTIKEINDLLALFEKE